MMPWAFLVLCSLILAAPHIPSRVAWILSLSCAAWSVLFAICSAIAAALG